MRTYICEKGIRWGIDGDSQTFWAPPPEAHPDWSVRARWREEQEAKEQKPPRQKRDISHLVKVAREARERTAQQTKDLTPFWQKDDLARGDVRRPLRGARK